jgi:hypothetical protein
MVTLQHVKICFLSSINFWSLGNVIRNSNIAPMGNNKLRYEISLYELSPEMLPIRNSGDCLYVHGVFLLLLLPWPIRLFGLFPFRIKFKIMNLIELAGFLWRVISSRKDASYTEQKHTRIAKKTSMSRVGFEPTILVFEQVKIFPALHLAATHMRYIHVSNDSLV